MTVALLAIGLFAAGIGTMQFLRNTLIGSLDASLSQAASTDVASGLIEITVDGNEVTFVPRTDAASSEMWVAIYGTDGTLITTAGGTADAGEPDFPDSFTLEKTAAQGTTPFTLENTEGGSDYHAAVDIYPIDGGAKLFTQMVASPLAPINQVVTTFLGIYGILAIIVIVGGALLTRFLVTLAFRGLGQVETTAMAIADGDFSQRMTDIEPSSTEVGRLKQALNTMLGHVDDAIGQREATVRQMRRFIGDASHELRTPLVTVRGYAELYRMGAITGDEDVAQAMDRIESEAKRMGLLVEDLLALARLDERKDVVVSPVDLRDVARDAALDLRATSPLREVTVIDTTVPKSDVGFVEDAGEDAEASPASPRRTSGNPAISIAGATLSLLRRKPRPVPASQATGLGDTPSVAPIDLTLPAAGSSAIPPIVIGDENKVRQVIANLLGNAKRFTADDSPIDLRIGIDQPAGAGWIEIADHGEGIPDQIKERIFERFWRADTSRARETGGTGLGLSIVASIMEAHHGSVSVSDTPGGGATFRVAFPLAAERDAAEHLAIETQPIPRPRPED